MVVKRVGKPNLTPDTRYQIPDTRYQTADTKHQPQVLQVALYLPCCTSAVSIFTPKRKLDFFPTVCSIALVVVKIKKEIRGKEPVNGDAAREKERDRDRDR